jgi:hypothetical protein
MPIHDSRPLRRSKRFCALITTCLALSAGSLAVPSSASAYEEHFCQFALLAPGWECYAPNRHTLQAVRAVANGYYRICAASFTSPWGTQNSDWRCDYGEAWKSLGGRVDGVGAIHNGYPAWYYVYGYQYF